jgi:hypothetical protein
MINHIGQKRLDVQNDLKVMVCCGIHGIKLFGPYFYNANVSGETYIAVLNEVLEPLFR